MTKSHKSPYTIPRTLFNTFEVSGIQQLIMLGHNVNEQRSYDGFSPLFSALGANKIDAVKELLLKGADPTLVNKAGFTVLDLALSSLYYDVNLVNLLIEKTVVYVTRTEQPKNSHAQTEIVGEIKLMQDAYKMYRKSKYDAKTVSAIREDFKENLEELQKQYQSKGPSNESGGFDNWEEVAREFTDNSYSNNHNKYKDNPFLGVMMSEREEVNAEEIKLSGLPSPENY